MRKKFHVLIFTLKIWIFINEFKLAESDQAAPLIDTLDSLTIDVNNGKTIDCKSEAPITWLFETSEKLHDSIKISHSKDDEGSYHSHLEISFAQVELVGFYYCVFNTSLSNDVNYNYQQKIKSHEASSIYVYVNDPDNKLYESDQYIIFGKQNEPLTIPCKPTSPEIKVELVRDDDEENISGKYDPKIGFTVSFRNDEDSDFFKCRLEDDPEVYNEFQVIINGQETSDYFIKPWIISDSQNLAKNGASFSLSCHIEMISDAPYVIDFFLPNGKEAKNTDYLILSEIKIKDNDSRKSHRNLTIHNAVQERDEGMYTCLLKDIYNNIYSAVTLITFVDKPVVQLNSSNPIVIATNESKSVKFHFNYFIYPKPNFEWLNPENNLIKVDQVVQNDTKYITSISDDEISLTIRHPGKDDFGEFKLVATTDGERFEKIVKLIFTEKPTCQMENTYVMQEEDVHIKCECMGYPPSEIIFSYQICQNLTTWPECSEGETNELSSEAHISQISEYIQSSEIKFKVAHPGTIKCRAKNEIGEDAIDAKVQIVDLSEPFLLSSDVNIDNIVINDHVILQCGAIIYNYSDTIKWTKNGLPVEEGKDIHIKDSNTRFSYRKSLTFDSIKKENDGEFRCEIYDKEKKELYNVSILVNVHENKPPVIVTNFKQENISEYTGNSLTLSCTVSGFPIPSLKWFKNEEPIEIIKNDSRILLKDNNMTLMFTELKLEDNGFYQCVAENPIGKEA